MKGFKWCDLDQWHSFPTVTLKLDVVMLHAIGGLNNANGSLSNRGLCYKSVAYGISFVLRELTVIKLLNVITRRELYDSARSVLAEISG